MISREVTAAYTHAAANPLLDDNTLSLPPSLSNSVNKTALFQGSKQTNPIPRAVTAPYTQAVAKVLLDDSILSLPLSLSTSFNKTALFRAPSKPTRYTHAAANSLLENSIPSLPPFFLPPLIKWHILVPQANQPDSESSHCCVYPCGCKRLT
jgi:hypothetical protein